jgi:very-short-patch-repair endonuclease
LKKLTTEEFIKKAKKIHGDKYDYSLVDYKKSHSNIKIICPTHGIFNQLPNNHLGGKGCIKCTNKEKLNTKIFIDRSNNIHNNKYDYSLSEYKNNKNKIKIICPTHGIFEQKAYHHLDGIGCPKCVGKNKTTEEFIENAKKIHGDKYDYSLVIYYSAYIKIKIICPIHGIFEQIPHNHINYNGCPYCKESYGEKKIRLFLINNKIKFIKNKKFNDCKYKSQLPFDFYLDEYNICIEYDGIQHFKIIKYFGNENDFIKLKIRDSIKTEYCKKNNIILLRIKYTDYNNIELILTKYLKL